MAEDLTSTIQDAAQNPKRAQVDNVQAESHSIPDLIKADQYLQAKKAAKQPHFGLRFGRLVPPGSV